MKICEAKVIYHSHSASIHISLSCKTHCGIALDLVSTSDSVFFWWLFISYTILAVRDKKHCIHELSLGYIRERHLFFSVAN